MKIILLAIAVLAASAYAGTQITDTLRYADGTLASGTVTITWNTFISSTGTPVPANTRTVQVVGGAFNVVLTANDVASPTAPYTVQYVLGTRKSAPEFWIVPDTGAVLTIAQVRVTNPFTAVAPAQLVSGGATPGQTLCLGNNYRYGPCTITGGSGGGSQVNSDWVATTGAAQILNKPTSMAPTAHATTHKNGGSDEVATATPAVNAIPKADSSGKLATGWIPPLAYQTVLPTGSQDQYLAGNQSLGTFPDCPDSGGNHMNRNPVTHAFECGNTAGTVASVAFSTVTPGVNTAGAFTFDTGSSLNYSGTAFINANRIMGVPLSTLTGLVKLTAGVPSIAVLSDITALTGTGATAVTTFGLTIPAAQVAADWNASTGVTQVLNKPTLAAVATSGSYLDLSNRPSILVNPMTTLGQMVAGGASGVPAAINPPVSNGIWCNNYTSGTWTWAPCASGGDLSSNTSTSVDSEIALFSAGSGKVIKRAAGSGMARISAGILSSSELSGDATTTGSNVVTVARLNGTAVPVNAASDTMLGTTASATGAWFAVPNCSGSTSKLLYNTATHTFTCGVDLNTGGSPSPLTTKGDLWGFSTVDARLAVGSDGTVPIADSTVAMGVRWGAIAGGSGAGVPIVNDGGSAANIYTACPAGAPALIDGSAFLFRARNASTGPSSMAYCGGSSKKLMNSDNTDLGVGHMPQSVMARWNGGAVITYSGSFTMAVGDLILDVGAGQYYVSLVAGTCVGCLANTAQVLPVTPRTVMVVYHQKIDRFELHSFPRLATSAEALTGTDTTSAVTPAGAALSAAQNSGVPASFLKNQTMRFNGTALIASDPATNPGSGRVSRTWDIDGSTILGGTRMLPSLTGCPTGATALAPTGGTPMMLRFTTGTSTINSACYIANAMSPHWAGTNLKFDAGLQFSTASNVSWMVGEVGDAMSQSSVQLNYVSGDYADSLAVFRFDPSAGDARIKCVASASGVTPVVVDTGVIGTPDTNVDQFRIMIDDVKSEMHFYIGPTEVCTGTAWGSNLPAASAMTPYVGFKQLSAAQGTVALAWVSSESDH